MKREDKAKAGYVGVKPKRKRVFAMQESKRRRLPDIPLNLREEVEAARARTKARPASPGVSVYTRGDGSHFIDSPHRDLDAWEVQICDAFGTRSHSVMWTFLDQFAQLCRSNMRASEVPGGEWTRVPDQYELNFIVATIQAERPKTPLQAAMLAQMIANHMLQMRIGADLLGLGGNYVPGERVQTLAKLANAFANQTEAYQKLRGRSPKAQRLEVTYRRESHVYFHAQKGDSPGPPADQFPEQSREPIEVIHCVKKPADGVPAIEHQGRAEVRSEEPAGVVVPMSRAQGKGQV